MMSLMSGVPAVLALMLAAAATLASAYTPHGQARVPHACRKSPATA